MTLEKQIELLKEWHKLAGTEMYLPIMSSEDIDRFMRWLEDYKQLKYDYIELDNQIRKANTENDELKRMLVDAMDVLYNVPCDGTCSYCHLICQDGKCKWLYHDEAMELLGGNENDNG